MTAKKKTLAEISREAPAEAGAIEMLRKTCKDGGQIVLAQVRNATGANYKVRTADALIVETWKSRGMGFIGVEYKRHRHDWLREMRDPAKADEIAQYCRGWLILAPAGLVQLGELPTNWGLWEIKGKRIFRTVKPPPMEAKAPTLPFICAILRSNQTIDPSLEVIFDAQRSARKELQDKHESEVNEIRQGHRALQDKVRQFRDATGLSLDWNMDGSIEDAKAILSYLRKPEQFTDRLDAQREELVKMLAAIDTVRKPK